MKTIRFLGLCFILSFVFSWTPLKGQDYSEDPNRKILKEAVVGAGVGAISAGASGGKAGKGALIGAGTNVIGNALLDAITTPPQPRYAPYVNQGYVYNQPQRKIIRKYDSDGNVVSEEEVWQ